MRVTTLLAIFSSLTAKCMTNNDYAPLHFKVKPAPDVHRCGVCPTYLRKECAFNAKDNTTYIFDNHCILDVYNCIEGTKYIRMNYEYCLYFGNFAYVHGLKHEDEDYDDRGSVYTNKNPDF